MTKTKEGASVAFRKMPPRAPTSIDTAGAANIKEEEDGGSSRAEWKEWEKKRSWVSPMRRSTDKGMATHEERVMLAS